MQSSLNNTKQYKHITIQTIHTNNINAICNLFKKNSTQQYNTIAQYKPYKQTTEQQHTIYAKSIRNNTTQ